MTFRWHAVLCVVLGVVAFVWPAIVWWFIVDTQLRDPEAWRGEGGMFIAFILWPLALLGTLVCGIPAMVLQARDSSGGWRWVGSAFSVLGMVLAIGTYIGPRILADAIR